MSQTAFFAQSLDDAITEAHQILADADAHFGPFVYRAALFSGGDDSTVMLHLVANALPTAMAVHIDTGWGLAETREFVKRTAAEFLVPLRILQTDPAWYEADVRKNGFPQPMTHSVMYHNLKRERLRDLKREVKIDRLDRVALYTGERAYESQRRMGYGGTTARAEGSLIWVNPIHFFDARLMNEYRTRFDLPRNPVSDLIHRSGECLCMAMMRPEEWDEIQFWKPDDPTVKRLLALQATLEREDIVPPHKRRPCWQKIDPKAGIEAPGPLCSSCTARLFDTEPVS
jgi:3'-phosphoadenosine 5'-phosphosulfate sulfotransferase (PAPS reductase)/FAD synthetase